MLYCRRWDPRRHRLCNSPPVDACQFVRRINEGNSVPLTVSE